MESTEASSLGGGTPEATQNTFIETRPNRNILLKLSETYSFIPVHADGSKRALISWAGFCRDRPTAADIDAWLNRISPFGIAIICGAVSGNLEVMDFDQPDVVPLWAQAVQARLGSAFLKRLLVVRTPSKGRHVYYRCEAVEGNQKLARTNDGMTAIETRGKGGYVLSPFCPGACHPSGERYIVKQGDIFQPPAISAEERKILHDAARALNTHVLNTHVSVVEPKRRSVTINPPGDLSRPGDDFNARASWEEILAPFGWTLLRKHGTEGFWRRPGKQDDGHSATSNYRESDCFYVFSSSAPPFEPETSYTKFGTFALLNHRGDLRAAAHVLAARGFGRQRIQIDATDLVAEQYQSADDFS